MIEPGSEEYYEPTLGTYGNVDASFADSGCFAGLKCLLLHEDAPIGSTSAYLAYATQLAPGDTITASFYGKGSGTARVQIGAHFVTDDLTDLTYPAESAAYVGANGVWGKSEQSWVMPPNRTGLIIEAWLLVTSSNNADVWIDALTVTVVSQAMRPLLSVAPAYISLMSEPGALLGVDSQGVDNVVVEQVSQPCYSAPSCFKVSEHPLLQGNTPTVWVAAVHGVSPYDIIYARAWVRGAEGSTGARIVASYFEDAYKDPAPADGDYYRSTHPCQCLARSLEYRGYCQASFDADSCNAEERCFWGPRHNVACLAQINTHISHHDAGPSDLSGQGGMWGVTEYAWPIAEGRTGLLIEIEIHCVESAYNSVFIDDLTISTNSSSAYVVVAPVAPPPPPPPLSSSVEKLATSSVVALVAAKVAATLAESDAFPAPPPPWAHPLSG